MLSVCRRSGAIRRWLSGQGYRCMYCNSEKITLVSVESTSTEDGWSLVIDHWKCHDCDKEMLLPWREFINEHADRFT